MNAATLCNKLYDGIVDQARWNSEVSEIQVRMHQLVVKFIDNIIVIYSIDIETYRR